MTKGNRPQDISNRLRTGTALQAWRNQMALSAKELAKLIGVTERTIHRAERTNKLGSKIKLGMELLQLRLAHGEITASSGSESHFAPWTSTQTKSIDGERRAQSLRWKARGQHLSQEARTELLAQAAEKRYARQKAEAEMYEATAKRLVLTGVPTTKGKG
jgi:DNA-binding XRE family transcriptional regulator